MVSDCRQKEAQKYKIYKKNCNATLKHKYFCEDVNGRCKLEKCPKYSSCVKKEKKNFETWINAFNKSKKEELERLVKGGS